MALSNSPSEDFVLLPITMPPLPSFPVVAVHELRLRRNTPKNPTVTDSRSLFLKNIPTDSTEAHFRALFTDLVGAGRFETIMFEDEPREPLAIDPAITTRLQSITRKRKRGGDDSDDEAQARLEEEARLPEIWTRRIRKSGSSAVVLLADEKSVSLVLRAAKKLEKTKKYPTWGSRLSQGAGSNDDDDEESDRNQLVFLAKTTNSAVAPLGSAWVVSHLRACRASEAATSQATQAAVRAFFTEYNRKEHEAAELAKRLRNEPDEDGFVTVTRGGGRNGPANQAEADEARRRMVERDSKKKDEMQDFYRFQMRARRKAEQEALVKKFDEDKARVKSMREKRRKTGPEA